MRYGNDGDLRVVVVDSMLQRHADVLTTHAEGGIRLTWCTPGDDAAIETALADADAFVGSRLTATEAAAGARLRLVQAAGAGTDKIAIDALDTAEVAVANVFGHERSIAEYVMMQALVLSRDLLPSDAALRRGEWANPAMDDTLRVADTLHGRTLGLIGYGHIGQATAALAAAFGMRVVATRSRTPSGPIPDGLAWLGGPERLDELLSEADVVAVTVPLDAATRGLVGTGELARMKSSALLINVARGPVVDERALWEALAGRRIAGAALDVWYGDPPPPGQRGAVSAQPFAELDNVVLTPHVSGVTQDTFGVRARDIGQNLARLCRGEPLTNVVAGPAVP